jgi:hypothetical protein
MQVDCRVCGTSLRPAELFGTPIRRKAEPSATPLADDEKVRGTNQDIAE